MPPMYSNRGRGRRFTNVLMRGGHSAQFCTAYSYSTRMSVWVLRNCTKSKVNKTKEISMGCKVSGGGIA